MYVPHSFKMTEKSDIHAFIEEFGFGVLVSSSLIGTHLPFLLAPEEGDLGTLYTHCAKANPHWRELDNQRVLLIFNGPHSYISPTWYNSAPAVPTWNYLTVHAYGIVKLMTSEDTLLTLDRALSKYEPDLLANKQILPDSYKDKLSAGIVGLKIILTELEGQQKLGQQRSEADQAGVFQALSNSSKLADLALANYMREHR